MPWRSSWREGTDIPPAHSATASAAKEPLSGARFLARTDVHFRTREQYTWSQWVGCGSTGLHPERGPGRVVSLCGHSASVQPVAHTEPPHVSYRSLSPPSAR